MGRNRKRVGTGVTIQQDVASIFTEASADIGNAAVANLRNERFATNWFAPIHRAVTAATRPDGSTDWESLDKALDEINDVPRLAQFDRNNPNQEGYSEKAANNRARHLYQFMQNNSNELYDYMSTIAQLRIAARNNGVTPKRAVIRTEIKQLINAYSAAEDVRRRTLQGIEELGKVPDATTDVIITRLNSPDIEQLEIKRIDALEEMRLIRNQLRALGVSHAPYVLSGIELKNAARIIRLQPGAMQFGVRVYAPNDDETSVYAEYSPPPSDRRPTSYWQDFYRRVEINAARRNVPNATRTAYIETYRQQQQDLFNQAASRPIFRNAQTRPVTANDLNWTENQRKKYLLED